MTVRPVRNVIIGSGEAGKSLAWHLAQRGEDTVVVERQWIGGSCPNINCLPSKNEIWSAKVVDLARHGAHFGAATANLVVDMAAVRARKRAMVDALVKVHLDKYRATGAKLRMGHATFISPRQVEVQLNDGGTEILEGERFFLNLGTRAAMPAVKGLAESKPMTHIDILELDRLPSHLVVIGGGYVGLEFAQAYRRFGSQVTIIQHGPTLLRDEDPDVLAEVTRILVAGGINITTSAEVESVTGRSGEAVSIQVKTANAVAVIQASDILVAAGRTPNTAGMRLDAAGVALDARGYLQVNERLETTAANIWGLGECAGSPQFTHASYDDFRVVRDNLDGGNRTTTNRLMPSCLFIDPPLAHIGLTENDAAKKGLPVRVAKLPMKAVLRTRTLDETVGFMKALIDNEDRIVGFTMIGPEAGEVMAVVQLAMIAGLRFPALRDAILTHPTMAEGLNVLFATLEPRT